MDLFWSALGAFGAKGLQSLVRPWCVGGAQRAGAGASGGGGGGLRLRIAEVWP